MQEVSALIHAEDQASKVRKEQEWKRASAEHERILKEASVTACLFTEDEFDPLIRKHDDRRCRKHYLERVAARLKISIHEALLPTDKVLAKALVFELCLPRGFAAWRDSTWHILHLARRDQIQNHPPRVVLREYSGFVPFLNSTECNVTLASPAKSFHDTHYAHVPFPTPLDKVCLQHGLKYGMYDHNSGLWTGRQLEKPSFPDLCSPQVPTKSIYGSLRQYLHPLFERKLVSWNDVIASQTLCPTTLSIAEYSAFQDLRLGRGLQWLSLLRELASSNLNFGSIEVGILVTQLALVAGPPEGHSPLRASHRILDDGAFCKALAAQIRRRLESIASNWREGQTVECLLTLLQRIWSLTSSVDSAEEAKTLLLYVRDMTHSWTQQLRKEICNATDVKTAQKRSRDAVLAALLCRKTFIIEAVEAGHAVQAGSLTIFLECSFTLKVNLSSSETAYIAKMTPSLRKSFISDIKLVRRLEAQLRVAIDYFQSAVSDAVNNMWVEADGQVSRQFTSWTFCPAPHDGWITAQSIAAGGLIAQTVLFDLFEGTLYIDNQLLGRLPDDYTRQEFFREFFGDRIFLTRVRDEATL